MFCLTHYPTPIISVKVFYYYLKAGPSKKRPTESVSKTPVPDKKAKFVTPQKTGELLGF